jgi:protein sprouty homolog 2
MDRRNGGSSHMAPPRPPKSIHLPRIHRPRAPDPNNVDTIDSSAIHIISTSSTQHPTLFPISKMSSNIIKSTSSINSSSSSSTTNSNISHSSIPSNLPPTTAPLTPLQPLSRSPISINSSTTSTFSRRRTEMPPTQQQQQQQQRISAATTTTTITQPRSLTPSTLVTPTANLISNAFNTVVRRSPSPVNNNVTLQIPRPENERLPNEYVDTPFTKQQNNKLTTPGSRHSLATSTVPNRNINNFNDINSSGGQHTNISIIDGISVLNNNLNSNNNNILNSFNNSNHQHQNSSNNKLNLPNRTVSRPSPLLPITKQPSFRSTNTICKKDANALHQRLSNFREDNILNSQNATNNNGLNLNSASDQFNTIICPQCNRCRCDKCLEPRELPQKWICNNCFLCSADTILDYASCLCCVKGLYYHCAKDHEQDCDNETIRCADNPCSCAPYKRVSRWGCLSALSLILPCLLCYWPMRGCVSLCAKCYAMHSRHGCRCSNTSSNVNNSLHSRLNIINLTSQPGHEQLPNYHYHQRSNNNDLTPEKRLLDASSNEY